MPMDVSVLGILNYRQARIQNHAILWDSDSIGYTVSTFGLSIYGEQTVNVGLPINKTSYARLKIRCPDPPPFRDRLLKSRAM